jgi:hypothetical protein
VRRLLRQLLFRDEYREDQAQQVAQFLLLALTAVRCGARRLSFDKPQLDVT